jgi:hypothetical protein
MTLAEQTQPRCASATSSISRHRRTPRLAICSPRCVSESWPSSPSIGTESLPREQQLAFRSTRAEPGGELIRPTYRVVHWAAPRCRGVLVSNFPAGLVAGDCHSSSQVMAEPPPSGTGQQDKSYFKNSVAKDGKVCRRWSPRRSAHRLAYSSSRGARACRRLAAGEGICQSRVSGHKKGGGRCIHRGEAVATV